MPRRTMTCPICDGAAIPCQFCHGGSIVDPRPGVVGRARVAGISAEISFGVEAPSTFHRDDQEALFKGLHTANTELFRKIAKQSHRRVLVALVTGVTVEPSATDGVAGLCDDDIREILIGFGFEMSDSTVRHRRNDLVRWNLVNEYGFTANAQGNHARSWMPTPAGFKVGRDWADEVLR